MKKMIAVANDHATPFAPFTHTSFSPTRSQVSIIVPTFNEAKNIRPLVNRLSHVLSSYKWEVIFVDDNSSDMTWKTVKEIAQKDQRG